MIHLVPDIFAVVPVRARGLQRALAFLPLLAFLLLLALLAVVLIAKRRAVLARLQEGLKFRIVAAIGLACVIVLGIAAALATFTLPGRPTPGAGTGSRTISRGPWMTFMGNGCRTGAAPGTTGPAKGEKLWSFCDGVSRAAFAGSPAVSGDRVYVGSDNRKLYCFDTFTGRVVWEFRAAFEIFAAPVVSGDRVFVGEGLHYSEESKLYCLNATNGESVWSFQTASHVEFSPTLFDGKLYFGAGEDGVYCLDAKDGRKVWQYAEVHVDMSPAVTESGVLFGNIYGEPGFHCVNREDGKLLWRSSAPVGVSGSPSTDGGRVYFGIGNGTFAMSHAQPRGAVWCLSAADGSKVWECEVKDAVLTTVALSRGSAYFGSRDGHLYCVDTQTGAIRWSFDTGGPVLSSPAVVDGRAYFGSDNGCVYCVDAASGEELWRFDTSQVTFSVDARVQSSPAVANDRIYVGSMNSHFFCLGATALEEGADTGLHTDKETVRHERLSE